MHIHTPIPIVTLGTIHEQIREAAYDETVNLLGACPRTRG